MTFSQSSEPTASEGAGSAPLVRGHSPSPGRRMRMRKLASRSLMLFALSST